MKELPLILVVEEDGDGATFVADALTEGGFESTGVGTGEEAVMLLNRGFLKFCALVTEVDLFGSLNGWEVARAARAVDPRLPVVYISGISAQEWPAQGVPDSVILRKPFASSQLVTAISHLLNRRL